MISLCDFSVFSVPLWFVLGGWKSEMRCIGLEALLCHAFPNDRVIPGLWRSSALDEREAEYVVDGLREVDLQLAADALRQLGEIALVVGGE